MAHLTQAQIDMILTRARALGMEQSQIDGLRATLLKRSADLDAETSLSVALEAAEPTLKEMMDEFIAAQAEAHAALMRRGRDTLNAMSDAEWNAIFEGVDDAG